MRKLIKLDLGCGAKKKKGFIGVDNAKTPVVDVIHDLFKLPWPFDDESVSEVHCSHFFEHVPAHLRVPMMDELYRILVPGKLLNGHAKPHKNGSGKAMIITPYWSSMRAYQDPTHQWPPVCETSYLYFNKNWRVANKLTHYLGTCDFDYSFAYHMFPETAAEDDVSQDFHIRHFINSVADLHVTLVKRPK